MADSEPPPASFSLRRWSQRKLSVARAQETPAAAPAVPMPPAAAPAITQVPIDASPAPQRQDDLPPVATLTIDSDFSVFMKPEVDEGTKRAALKKLFSDPQFNVMDGLDIYTGDYTQPDPMPAGMLDKLADVYARVTEADSVAVSDSVEGARAAATATATATESGQTEDGPARETPAIAPAPLAEVRPGAPAELPTVSMPTEVEPARAPSTKSA